MNYSNTPYIKLDNTGILVPKNFPANPYKKIYERMVKYKDDYKDSWHEFAGGWNAVSYRFLICFENYELFTETVKKYTNAPPQPYRYIQERELFSFFVSGLSTIESICYSLYAICSILKSSEFPINEDDLRNIKPEVVKSKLKCNFENEKITSEIENLTDDTEYFNWKKIRNVLAHRTSPRRHIYTGGEMNGKALWLGLEINENTTSSKFDWLIDKITYLVNGVDDFTLKYLGQE